MVRRSGCRGPAGGAWVCGEGAAVKPPEPTLGVAENQYRLCAQWFLGRGVESGSGGPTDRQPCRLRMPWGWEAAAGQRRAWGGGYSVTPASTPEVRLLGPALGARRAAAWCAVSRLRRGSHSERRGRSKRRQVGPGRKDGSGWRGSFLAARKVAGASFLLPLGGEPDKT